MPGITFYRAIWNTVTGPNETPWDPALVFMNACLFIALIVAFIFRPEETSKNSFILYNFAVRDVTPVWHFEERGEKFEQDGPYGPDLDMYLQRLQPVISEKRAHIAEDHCEMMDAPNDSSAHGYLDYHPADASSIPRANWTWGIFKAGQTTVDADETDHGCFNSIT